MCAAAMFCLLSGFYSAFCSGCADQFEGDPAWVKKSIAELQKRFCQGLAFFVVAPTFQTLRQQTLERIVKAGLAEGSSEDVVNPYSWASKARLVHVMPHCHVTCY